MSATRNISEKTYLQLKDDSQRLATLSDPANITVSRTCYDLMQADSDLLSALHDAGVDNWEGYAEACSAVGNNEEDD